MTAALNWQKSSFSGVNHQNAECVELAADGAARRVRESSRPDEILSTSPSRLRALVLGIKAGEFDSPER